MKRELAQILDAKSPGGESLGRTRSSPAAKATEDSERANPGSSSKRLKGCVVDGVIVYTRGRKARRNAVESESRPKSFSRTEGRPKKKESELVEVVVEDDSKEGVKVKKELVSTEQSRSSEGGAVEVLVVMADQNGGSAVRRFTRSALKPKEEPQEEEEEPSVAGSPQNKLELKMSKKIALHKKPTTVKELFHTGLVDGVSVVYMGGKKVTPFSFSFFALSCYVKPSD